MCPAVVAVFVFCTMHTECGTATCQLSLVVVLSLAHSLALTLLSRISHTHLRVHARTQFGCMAVACWSEGYTLTDVARYAYTYTCMHTKRHIYTHMHVHKETHPHTHACTQRDTSTYPHTQRAHTRSPTHLRMSESLDTCQCSA